MSTEVEKFEIVRFPLQLTPSVLQEAQSFSQKEGLSLNEFISSALADKLVRLQHEEWVRSRAKPTRESMIRGLELLYQGGNAPPESGDELPEGYVSGRGNDQDIKVP